MFVVHSRFWREIKMFSQILFLILVILVAMMFVSEVKWYIKYCKNYPEPEAIKTTCPHEYQVERPDMNTVELIKNLREEGNMEKESGIKDLGEYRIKCSCGCGSIVLTGEEDNGHKFYYMSYELSAFYAYQGHFKDALRLIWNIIRGKRYGLFEVIIYPQEFEELRQSINKMP